MWFVDEELKSLGFSDAEFAKLAPFAGVKRVAAPPPRDDVKDPPIGGKDPPIGGKDPPAVPELDLNAATVTELKTLPGITEDDAKKIVANRPYAAVTDLARADLPAGAVARVRSLVTIEAPALGGIPLVQIQYRTLFGVEYGLGR